MERVFVEFTRQKLVIVKFFHYVGGTASISKGTERVLSLVKLDDTIYFGCNFLTARFLIPVSSPA